MSEEDIQRLKELNPGSVISPELYSQAYDIYQLMPKRFEALYGQSMRAIRKRKGMFSVGIFAHETGLFPEKGLPKDIALDLKAAHDFRINRGDTVKVLTGVRLIMPDGVYASVRGRSGLSLKGIDVLAGVIDPQYRGEIGVTLTRASSGFCQTYHRLDSGEIDFKFSQDREKTYRFKKGDRIAQLIFVPFYIYIYPVFEVKRIPKTERGERGYGSTGTKTKKIG